MAELMINGKVHHVNAEEDTPLLWTIRDSIGLTGVRLRYPAVWCLHGTDRQASSALLRHHSGRGRGQGHYNHRGAVSRQPPSGANGMGRGTGPSVRLLPVRTDHGSILTTGTKPKPNGPGDRPCYA